MRIADVADCYEKHADALLHFAAAQVGAVDAEDVLSAAIIGVLQTSVDVDDLQRRERSQAARPGSLHAQEGAP
ncbi:MAG: hypothetical protein M3337_08830 [Actinomycetota bacterium]|nr:hypothetical protein [Actinomycetota bacterium]